MKKSVLSRIFRASLVLSTIAVPAALLMSLSTSASAATMSESLVQNYASAMKQAANSKNINQVSNLVSDDVLISISRRGKSTSLDKNAYLKLLQSSWNQASNYRYDIVVENIVTSGDQAKADVRTVETWTKDGKNTTLTTSSRATLKAEANGAVLLRAVAQVTVDEN